MDETTDFGFSRVPVAEKRPRVRAVFDSVAPRYDLMNDLMSVGLHRVWKGVLLAALDPRPTRTLLDLAGGSGDVTRAWLAAGGGPAVLSDINISMLTVGRGRVAAPVLCADAEALPFAAGAFDTVSIAFGLRNCTEPAAVLREARRVLRPGGRFACLEFSQLTVAALRPAYDAWSFQVLPRLGRVIAGDADSYRYLAESIRVFPPQARLAAMMTEAGFSRVAYRNLTGGIVALHTGRRL